MGSHSDNPPASSTPSSGAKKPGRNDHAIRQLRKKLTAVAASKIERSKAEPSGTSKKKQPASTTTKAAKPAVPKPLKPAAPSPTAIGLWSQKFGSPVPKASPASVSAAAKPAVAAPSQLHNILKQKFGSIVSKPEPVVPSGQREKPVRTARRQPPIMALFRQALASNPQPVAGTLGAGKGAGVAQPNMELFRKFNQGRTSLRKRVSRIRPTPESLSLYENVRAVFFPRAGVKDPARIRSMLGRSMGASGWLRKTSHNFAIRNAITGYLSRGVGVKDVYLVRGLRKLNPGPALRRGAARMNPAPAVNRLASGQLPYVTILLACMISMSIVGS